MKNLGCDLHIAEILLIVIGILITNCNGHSHKRVFLCFSFLSW